MKKYPDFSIIMSVCNEEKTLKKSIESVLKQTFKNFEFIIINDGSTDNSGKIIKSYSKKDKRIKIIKNSKNLGLTESLNKGLLKAKGNFIARIDADDWWHKSKLKKQLNFLRLHKDYGVIGTNGYRVDESGKIIGKIIFPSSDKKIKQMLLLKNCIIHSSVIIKKVLLEKHGPYKPRFEYSQDYELWLRLYNKAKFYNLNEFLVFNRIRNNNISARKWKKQEKNVIRARYSFYKKNNSPLYFYLTLIPNVIKLSLPSKTKLWKRKIMSYLKQLQS